MSLPVAMIDDETVHIEFYLKALGGLGYDTRHFKSPDSCLSALAAGDRFSLFVTDLMMPSFGKYSAKDTRDYLITGLCLAKDIRNQDRETPVMLFTNLNIETILAEVKRELASEPNFFVIRKMDYPPHILAETVDALLSGRDPFVKRKSLLRRFWDSLVLEPTVYGIGIDIKKLGQ
jgi:CheY-like chemotaxis protein